MDRHTAYAPRLELDAELEALAASEPALLGSPDSVVVCRGCADEHGLERFTVVFTAAARRCFECGAPAAVPAALTAA